MTGTAGGLGRSLSCSGAPACASRRRSSSPSTISTTGADRILIRQGKGGRRREVGMDEWGWEQLGPWLTARVELPVGPLFCIIDGPPCGRPWSGAAVRSEFRRLAAQAGVRRRFAPHQLRHAHALELELEGVPLNIIQRQLGHANLGTTSIYLQGIDPEEIIATAHMRRAPMMSASAGLRL
jgi:site-specific recombinase XerD